LSILVCNTDNVEEVVPEYKVAGDSIDYTLRNQNDNSVFLEIKRADADLAEHQEQLFKYCSRETPELAVLTNGITWWFYLPCLKGKWEDKRFYTIDILQQDPKDVINKFIDILSRENVISGGAIKYAESIHKNQRNQNAITKALPDAWNKILSENNVMLIDLISATAERLCGVKPEQDAVKFFLSEFRNRFFIELPPDSIGAPLGRTGTTKKGQRASRGQGTPSEKFRIPILESLIEMANKGRASEVLKRVKDKTKKDLRDIDMQTLASGVSARWEKNANFERYFMVQDGLLRSDSPWGIWEITEAGAKFYEQNKQYHK
jgi:hypothetical protein